MMLLGCGVSLAIIACGDDDGDTTTTGAQTSTSGTGGNSSSSSGSNTGGSNANSSSSSSSSGSNTGGANAGGANAGGANTGGAMAGACMAALVVKGSNYAKDPHDVMIPLADLSAGVTKTYVSTGNNHTHNLTLTKDDFTALRNGQTVKKYTCLDNPNYTDHEWVISCADPNIMPTFQGEIGTKNNCPGDPA